MPPRPSGLLTALVSDATVGTRAQVRVGAAAAPCRARRRGGRRADRGGVQRPGGPLPRLFRRPGAAGQRPRAGPGVVRQGAGAQPAAAQRRLRRLPGAAAPGPARRGGRRGWRSSRRSSATRAPRWPSSSTRGWGRWRWRSRSTRRRPRILRRSRWFRGRRLPPRWLTSHPAGSGSRAGGRPRQAPSPLPTSMATARSTSSSPTRSPATRPTPCSCNDGDVRSINASHPLSRVRGVRTALWGDIDDDGLLDVALLGNGTTSIWRQSPAGRWRDVTTAMRAPTPDIDAVDGALFDADHDGDLDLWLVNGRGAERVAEQQRRRHVPAHRGRGRTGRGSPSVARRRRGRPRRRSRPRPGRPQGIAAAPGVPQRPRLAVPGEPGVRAVRGRGARRRRGRRQRRRRPGGALHGRASWPRALAAGRRRHVERRGDRTRRSPGSRSAGHRRRRWRRGARSAGRQRPRLGRMVHDARRAPARSSIRHRPA